MTGKVTILLVDDDSAVLDAARIFLKREFGSVVTEKNPQRIPEHLRASNPDVILLDMNYSPGKNDGHEGLYWISRIHEIDPEIIIIPVTAYGETEIAVKAMKSGAVDFVVKPWSNEKLLATINSSLELKKARQEVIRLTNTRKKLTEDLDFPFASMIGNSAPMRKINDLISKVAPTDVDVLILGENGTGKELVARELHKKSKRSREAFITVDLGSLHEGIFESELFGHTKGAYTDAKEDRPGRFELASGGTIFLDEIGNLPVELQPKLLSVLQCRKLSRVGSNKEISIDVRMISATNQSLVELVRQNRFRQDLLFRINTFEIHVPALRERPDDIPLLLEHYLGVYSHKYNKPDLKTSPGLVRVLQEYTWPGNVREFHHAVEKAVILCDDNLITEKDFSPLYRNLTAVTFDSLNLEENEKNLVRKAMEKHLGNKSRAAAELGIDRTALHRRLKKYGI